MNLYDPAILARLMGLMCDAIALRGAGQAQQALAVLDQALALEPGFLPLHMQRAELLTQLEDHAGAVAACEACLDLAPDFEDARAQHRQCLTDLATICEAQLAGTDSGPRLSDPDAVLARTLLKLDRPLPALHHVERALADRPSCLDLRALRADILLRLNRHEEALACYGSAYPVEGDQAALCAFNQADIRWRMGEVETALAGFDEALRIRPDFAQARVGRSHMLLLQGDYERGWREHEARWNIVGFAGLSHGRLRSSSPAWRPGDDIEGRHVLLWAEQGLGDTLQFARYILPVSRRAARTTVCVPPDLLSLLAGAFPQCAFIANDKDLPVHDCHASLMSLPLLLGLHDPALGPAPAYLHPSAGDVDEWQDKLDALSGAAARRPRIGLVWAGRQYATINHSRDIPLSELAPLLELPCDFVSLQAEVPAGDLATFTRLDAKLHAFPMADWSDTAALVQALDLVVTVDTAVAHLAGAMNRPALLMLRLAGEWRWGRDTERTSWYPSLQLLRQQHRGRWESVVREVVVSCRKRFSLEQ